MDQQPKRILTTSARGHTGCPIHLKNLDYDNLQFEKGKWNVKQ